MSLKSLTLEQLRQERAAVEDNLNRAETELWEDRNTHNGPSFSVQWAIKRFRNELSNIEQELETRR